MGENTKIEWAHHTFNAWYGCTKVGPPCDNCYAEIWARRSGLVEWGPHAERRYAASDTWNKPAKWNAAAKRAGERRRVFCLSLGDWLDNQVPQYWRRDLAAEIEATPHLDWLLLTKRIQNYERLAPWPEAPANVWLGITCGDQREYDRDWPILRGIQAPVRFISYEPALGPLRTIPFPHPLIGDTGPLFPDWFIAGGESGGHARPPHPQWFRDLRDDCERNDIAFLFKQWGEWRAKTNSDGWSLGKDHIVFSDDGTPQLYRGWPPGGGTNAPAEFMERVGKKAAGRLLDGREHNGFPTPDGPSVTVERTSEHSPILKHNK